MFKYSYQAFLSKDKTIQVVRMIEEEKRCFKIFKNEKLQTCVICFAAGLVVTYSIFRVINHLVGGF